MPALVAGNVLHAIPAGDPGAVETAREMARLASGAVANQDVRRAAAEATRGIPNRDRAALARGCRDYVARVIEFRNDPNSVELVSEPRDTLRSLIGDCDDQATLLAAMLASIGVGPLAFAIARMKAGDSFSHVLCCWHDGTAWRPLETVDRGQSRGAWPSQIASIQLVPVPGTGIAANNRLGASMERDVAYETERRVRALKYVRTPAARDLLLAEITALYQPNAAQLHGLSGFDFKKLLKSIGGIVGAVTGVPAFGDLFAGNVKGFLQKAGNFQSIGAMAVSAVLPGASPVVAAAFAKAFDENIGATGTGKSGTLTPEQMAGAIMGADQLPGDGNFIVAQHPQTTNKLFKRELLSVRALVMGLSSRPTTTGSWSGAAGDGLTDLMAAFIALGNTTKNPWTVLMVPTVLAAAQTELDRRAGKLPVVADPAPTPPAGGVAYSGPIQLADILIAQADGASTVAHAVALNSGVAGSARYTMLKNGQTVTAEQVRDALKVYPIVAQPQPTPNPPASTPTLEVSGSIKSTGINWSMVGAMAGVIGLGVVGFSAMRRKAA